MSSAWALCVSWSGSHAYDSYGCHGYDRYGCHGYDRYGHSNMELTVVSGRVRVSVSGTHDAQRECTMKHAAVAATVR